MGSAPVAVFQRLHTSMYDPDFIQLEEDEVMDFQKPSSRRGAFQLRGLHAFYARAITL